MRQLLFLKAVGTQKIRRVIKFGGHKNLRVLNQFCGTFICVDSLWKCYPHILQVVFKLKKRCGELSEEELGKVSVQLLNCQSSVEERPIFPCTDHMVSFITISKGYNGEWF